MRLHTHPLRRNTKVRLIRSHPLFSDCRGAELAAIALIADEIVVADGRVLTQESASGEEFIAILEGSARVEHDGETVAELGAGDFAGEIALVTGRRRTATVVADGPVRALVIERHAFLDLLERSPSVRVKVEKAVSDRLDLAG